MSEYESRGPTSSSSQADNVAEPARKQATPMGVLGGLRARASSTTTSMDADKLALYLSIHEVRLRDAILAHLGDVVWPDPAPDLPFSTSGDRLFAQALSQTLVVDIVNRLRGRGDLRTLVYPNDPGENFRKLQLVNTRTGGFQRQVWVPTFGLHVAGMIERAIDTSLTKRIGPQYRAIVASRAEPLPTADELTSAHPLDPFVARALTRPGVVDVTSVPATEPAPAHQAVKVSVRWLGRVEPALWNFVQVAPSSASAIDVAATLWGPKKTTMAFAVQKYGDLFRIAPAHARQVIHTRYRSEVVGSSDTDTNAAASRNVAPMVLRHVDVDHRLVDPLVTHPRLQPPRCDRRYVPYRRMLPSSWHVRASSAISGSIMRLQVDTGLPREPGPPNTATIRARKRS